MAISLRFATNNLRMGFGDLGAVFAGIGMSINKSRAPSRETRQVSTTCQEIENPGNPSNGRIFSVRKAQGRS